MRNRAYVERICRELFTRSPHQVEDEMRGLITIFERIQALPSPLREERFMSLLLEERINRPNPRSGGALAA
jgi:hypothetical protein